MKKVMKTVSKGVVRLAGDVTGNPKLLFCYKPQMKK